MKKFVFTISGVAVMVTAYALGTFMTTFDKTYDISKGSKLGKAKCIVCHTDKLGKKLNAYGSDLKSAMKQAGVKKLNAEILRAVEQLDSNGDGVKNIDEIKGDDLPGEK